MEEVDTGIGFEYIHALLDRQLELLSVLVETLASEGGMTEDYV